MKNMRTTKRWQGLAVVCGVLSMSSCQWYWEDDYDFDADVGVYGQQQDQEALLPSVSQPPPPPAPLPPKVIHYPHVARNGVPPFREKHMPQDYADFRQSENYRLSFSTWKDDALLQSPGYKYVVIDLRNQRGVCYVDGRVAMDFPVCTGSGTHSTPTGYYRITEKDAHHWSNLYNCAMPYFMRLTNEGIGLHVGDVYRAPASHGCIRMTREACIALFNNLPRGTEVMIEP